MFVQQYADVSGTRQGEPGDVGGCHRATLGQLADRLDHRADPIGRILLSPTGLWRTGRVADRALGRHAARCIDRARLTPAGAEIDTEDVHKDPRT